MWTRFEPDKLSMLLNIGRDAKKPFLIDRPEKNFKSSMIQVNAMFTVSSAVRIVLTVISAFNGNLKSIFKLIFLSRV